MIKKYKHLFFDLDHTLWDFEQNAADALKHIYADFKLEEYKIGLGEFQVNFSKFNKYYWQLLDSKQITHQELREKRFVATMEALGQPIGTSTGLTMNEAFIKYLPLGKALINGTLEVLEALQPAYELHLITNGYYDLQKHKIVNSGISKYFNKLVTNDVAGALKPDPIIFQKGLDLAHAQAHESLMIGDNFDSDVIGALNFGIDVVFYNPERTITNRQPTFEIENLTDLIKILR